jgi:diadenosine tetraphosphate (Ap4A) HIT family hydrolase
MVMKSRQNERTVPFAVESAAVGDCLFCPDLLFSMNRKESLPAEDSVLIDDEEFFVIPDLAPIVVGHVLIISKRHVPSMRALDPTSFARLEQIASEVEARYSEKWGVGALILEHGATYPRSAGACIDHAHWHCAPDHVPVHDALLRRGLVATSSHPANLHDHLSAFRQPYLLVRHSSTVNVYRDPDVPCQFLRWMMADAAQINQWLWGAMYENADSKARFLETLRELSTSTEPRSTEVVVR